MSDSGFEDAQGMNGRKQTNKSRARRENLNDSECFGNK